MVFLVIKIEQLNTLIRNMCAKISEYLYLCSVMYQ